MRISTATGGLVLIGVVLLLGTMSVLGQQIVPSTQDLTIREHFVRVEIDNQVAQVRIEQTVYNPIDQPMEWDFILPVPKGAVISGITLCSGEECVEGELLEAEEARHIYEEIVRRTKDPALLEYLGEKAFRLRVFPIPAKGESKIELSYQLLLGRRGDVVELLYPLVGAAELFAINVAIKEDEPIGNIYSPSHEISVQRLSDIRAQVSFESADATAARDFSLYYTLSGDAELGIDFLTYRERDDDGYFVLLISPTFALEQDILPKDIVFILDVSGSMKGEKIEQAKESLIYALENLNPGDKFALIAFSDLIQVFQEGLLPAEEHNVEEALSFIEELGAGGSTDINGALLRGLDYFTEEGRLEIIVFLTDGLPTFGVSEPAEIIENVTRRNRWDVRLFAFGVGYDVNTILLDRLSGENGGFSTYVEPGESIEIKVKSFYNRVGSPLLQDLELDFGGMKVYDLYPLGLPDLFKGDQLQVVGRYKNVRSGNIVLKARRGGEEVSMAFDVNLAQESLDRGFLPRIWASRKVGYLLEQIRLYGEEEELVEQVIELAERHGILTPYTSYLASPEDELPPILSDTRALSAPTGQAAVKTSKALSSLKETEMEPLHDKMRQVKGETFLFRDGKWIISGYLGEEAIKVEFGSPAYFSLADEAKDHLALGDNVVFSWNGRFIEIVHTGEGGITSPEELSGLLDPTDRSTSSSDEANSRGLGSAAAFLAAIAILGLALLFGTVGTRR